MGRPGIPRSRSSGSWLSRPRWIELWAAGPLAQVLMGGIDFGGGPARMGRPAADQERRDDTPATHFNQVTGPVRGAGNDQERGAPLRSKEIFRGQSAFPQVSVGMNDEVHEQFRLDPIAGGARWNLDHQKCRACCQGRWWAPACRADFEGV
jgi:hypothetical protein